MARSSTVLFGAEATCGAGFVAAAVSATGLTPDGTGVGEAGFADGAVAVCCAGETDDGLGAGVAAAGAVVVAATTAVAVFSDLAGGALGVVVVIGTGELMMFSGVFSAALEGNCPTGGTTAGWTTLGVTVGAFKLEGVG